MSCKRYVRLPQARMLMTLFFLDLTLCTKYFNISQTFNLSQWKRYVLFKGRDDLKYLLHSEISQKAWLLNIDTGNLSSPILSLISGWRSDTLGLWLSRKGRSLSVNMSHLMYLFEFEEFTVQNHFHNKKMDIVPSTWRIAICCFRDLIFMAL